jgi:hypothetical protein
MIVALLDFWIVRRRSRAEQRGLLQETLDNIAHEKKTRETSREIGKPDGDSRP